MNRYYITQYDSEKGELRCPPVQDRPLYSYGVNGTSFDGIQATIHGYIECEAEISEADVAEYGLIWGPIPTAYYPINEELARRAKEMMSFSDYQKGSKTAEYRCLVDEAYMIAHIQKQRVDPMYHEKIDRLVDLYARRMAENMNDESRIGTMCPSVMIAGPANFPVRKKEKQNAASDRNMQEWQKIQGLIEKIKSTGTGGISGDDPDSLEKLREKRDRLVKHQELMKAANAAIRMKNTEEGDRRLHGLGFTVEEIAELRKPDYCGRVGYPSYELSNNNANIRRIEGRIKELEKRETEPAPEGWKFDGGEVVINQEVNRLQIILDGKPDEDIRRELKGEGFRWAPSQGAWQRQLTDNALRAIRRIKCIGAPTT